MREITVKLYQFDELDEKAKERAREWARNDQGMRGQYQFEYLIEDANTIGLDINSLDDHRANEGEFLGTALECARKILKNHGKTCETYNTAMRYIDALESKDDNITDVARHEFLHDLLEDYRVLYNQEIEYIYSNEAIDEDMRANEYEFTEGGKIA
jgi:hypothetical protein